MHNHKSSTPTNAQCFATIAQHCVKQFDLVYLRRSSEMKRAPRFKIGSRWKIVTTAVTLLQNVCRQNVRWDRWWLVAAADVIDNDTMQSQRHRILFFLMLRDIRERYRPQMGGMEIKGCRVVTFLFETGGSPEKARNVQTSRIFEAPCSENSREHIEINERGAPLFPIPS